MKTDDQIILESELAEVLYTKQLRDRFAETAMRGMVALFAGDGGLTVDELADDAYRVADAMLKARKENT